MSFVVVLVLMASAELQTLVASDSSAVVVSVLCRVLVPGKALQLASRTLILHVFYNSILKTLFQT